MYPLTDPTRRPYHAGALALVLTLGWPAIATAAPQKANAASNNSVVGLCDGTVDLNLWSPESYPAVSGFAPGQWTVVPDGSAVTQSVNGQPTFFHSDFDVVDTVIEGQISSGGGDDDYIGFALGYMPGDTSNAAAEYLLVDWKAGTQSFDFGAPACSPGSVAEAGLAVSRVFGVPTADEFWGHENFDVSCSDLNNGLEELARGTNLGSTGWVGGASYDFRFEYSASRLRVFVDGVLELDVSGSFPGGRMAFYNFSQAGVTYTAFSEGALASWSEYGNGWAGTNGVPSLGLSANPVLGTSIDVVVGNSAGVDSMACLLLSTNQAVVPTAFGGDLLVAQPYLDVTPLHPLPAAGTTVSFAIPADALLCGSKGYFQMFQLDAGASHGFSATRGLELTLGD